jgi:hypothetical protein
MDPDAPAGEGFRFRAATMIFPALAHLSCRVA